MLNLLKIKEEFGNFLGPKNPLTENLLWTLLPIAKKNESG